VLDARRPDGIRPDEIEAMLDAIPDLHPTLRAAAPTSSPTSSTPFDVTAVYDKPNQTLELRATVTPELVPEDEKPRPGNTRSGYLP
jgi:hypothetical protein